jgi:hypothetical protein
MVFGGFFFLIACLVLCLFVAAIFVKNNTAKLILGILAFVLTVFLILFLGILDATFEPNEEEYVGRFENGVQFLQLNEDMTWQADTSFNCSNGTWIYYDGLDYSSISLNGECDSTEVSIRIHNPSPNELVISVYENNLEEDLEASITLNRRKED